MTEEILFMPYEILFKNYIGPSYFLIYIQDRDTPYTHKYINSNLNV